MATLYHGFLDSLGRVIRKRCRQGAPKVNNYFHMLGTYFWDRTADDKKDEWRDRAHQYNLDNKLTGKKKVAPFWLFTKKFLVHKLMSDTLDTPVAQFLWSCLTSAEQQNWLEREAHSNSFGGIPTVMCGELRAAAGSCCCSMALDNKEEDAASSSTDDENAAPFDEQSQSDDDDSVFFFLPMKVPHAI